MQETPGQLLERFGSPLYVYDAQQVRRAYEQFRLAFAHPEWDIYYAIVCNKNPYLVRLLHQLGAGIHANTPGDAFAALNLGVPSQRIVYSGTNLDGADMAYLLDHGIQLHLDSLDQIKLRASLGSPGPIGLRLWLPQGAPRIGVAPEELPEALQLARAAGLTLVGLHVYTATNNRDPDRFLQALEGLIEASSLLPDLEFLDLGGGYGVGYRPGRPDLNLMELGDNIRQRFSQMQRPPRLLLEPGRILVAQSGSLYMRVVSVKERQGRRFVGVDSTVGNIVVESVYHPYHQVEAVEPRGPLLEIPTDVCGNTTHSRDFLARSCQLPPLAVGDILALRDVGAYGYATSSHFLNRPRPAEVVVDGGPAFLTTRRESLEDLVLTQVAR